MSTTAERPLRADARRNREHIVHVAREVFAERGTDASLDDIAKRARVGAGTLYRHFPTRESLIASTLEDASVSLCSDAAGCVGKSPAEEFRLWFDRLVEHLGSYVGLPDCVNIALGDPDSALQPRCTDLGDTTRPILDRAIADGSVRPGVTVKDVLVAASAVAWARESAAPDSADRLSQTLLAGLTREPA
ncbi:TetR/AcrR family transcriptional regulator [Compostimonas suwonensis]|uniref:AcrR family transcriptional regulator n=1 Tax=Compostimonas suwonensis TaxID=1048394 RepID=A0A2M9C4J7_9MICO|nr:TetR/AcrR family transcriptional regulator [Compostimonas suwonensis]PJJ65419.1 AcrR family transcriptional regulator [Compostimonas suwonensis]